MNATDTSHSNTIATTPQLAAMLARSAAGQVGTAQAGAIIHPARAAAVIANPTITPASPIIVVVKKSYTNPGRVRILLKTSARFRRSGTLNRTIVPTSGNIRIFTAAIGGTEITFNGTDNVFSGNRLTAGVRLFAQADGPSTNLGDYQLTLTLAAGPGAGLPVTVSMTAVSLTLDISASRPAPGVAPPPLAQPPAVTPPAGTVANDKWFGGRVLSAQDAGNNQERALLTIGPLQPAAFNGVLLLRQVQVNGNNIGALRNRVQVFDGTNETPTAGEVAKNNPHPIDTTVTPIPAGGLQFWVEGRNLSVALRDTGFQLGIQGADNDGDRVAITVGVAALITLASQTILVKKTYTNPARQLVTLRTGTPFPRTGTLTRASTAPGQTIRLFTAAVGGTEIAFNNTDNVFSGARLTAGVQLFAEAANFSPALNDFKLTLTLTTGAGVPAGLPGKASMTAVSLTLDISMSRTADATDPNPLPQPPAVAPAAGAAANDKWFGGRFVHLQDPGRHHGRALLIVRPIQPAAFNGTLVLRQVAVSAANNVTALDTKVQVFDNEFRPPAGEAAKANPHEINTTATPIPAGGLQFWVEGANVSAALRDTGFQLGIKDLENDGDRVAMTVMRFSNIQATVPSNAPNQARLGNGPVPASRLIRGAGAALVASDFEVDFTVNLPLILIENSLPAGSLVNLSVNVAPAGVPVLWRALRDIRALPVGAPAAGLSPQAGDDARIIALSPNPIPSVVSAAATPLQATLAANAVGSFHIRAFVDCNGNAAFDTTRNAEPFILMNLVLIRVGGPGSTNSSRAQPGNIGLGAQRPAPRPAPGAVFAPSSATGVRVVTGDFVAPATAAAHNDATVVVIGGGNNGTRGLDRLFGGWINNELAVATSPTVPQGEDVVSGYRDSAPAIPVRHQRISIWSSPRAVFTPATGPPPAGTLLAGPVLDVSPFGNEGTGGNTAVGTESVAAPGPNLAIIKVPNVPAAGPPKLGERWRVQMFDSPGDNCPSAHGFLPGTLVDYRFNLDFRSELVFWTNSVNAAPGPTPGPITGAAPPIPDAACCLYASVQTNTWVIRVSFTFNPATGVSTPGAKTVTMTPDANATRLAQAIVNLEVRAPISLNLLGVDASG